MLGPETTRSNANAASAAPMKTKTMRSRSGTRKPIRYFMAKDSTMWAACLLPSAKD